MKDNKIDIMCQKLGMMRSQLNLLEEGVKVVKLGIEVLQTDLELLRKCTLDNPNFKWNSDKTGGYTENKVDAFRND